MRNNTYVKWETICKKNKGYIATRKLVEEGFSNRQIAVLTEEGYLEKICHGFFWLNGRGDKKPIDYKCIEVCLSAPRAAICMESALYYQGRMKVEPEYLSVATIRTNRSLLKMRFPVNRHYFSENNFEIGLKKKKTEFGCYSIYDIERSLCDIIRLGSEIVEKSLIEIYKNENQRKRLLKYAELLKIKEV